jgi:hypothetical protein
VLPRDFPESYYSVFVTHPLDDDFITGLAVKIETAAQEKKYNELETVLLAISFVQNLPYTSDSVTTGYDEYPRYPIETLVDGGGDCEDTAILLASLIRAMGYGTVLIIYPGTAEIPGHCAVGVKGSEVIYGTYYNFEGEKYYYIETTNTGWEIGEIPDKYKGVSAYIYPMIPVPVFSHNWTTESSVDRIKLEVKVSNSGSAIARGVYIQAGFDAGNDQLWNSQKSPQFDIGIDQSDTVTLYLVPPRNVYTRLVVIVIYDGYAVDESYSLWYNT